MTITIEQRISAPIDHVWRVWTTPADIVHWNFATEGWHCPSARLDLRVGGSFCYRMEAVDGSMGFDFEGVFTRVDPLRLIEFTMGDGRAVRVEFSELPGGALIRESFEAEDIHSAEQQRDGWQQILVNFAARAEAVRG
ncbi:MAG: SRPBCC domain-containing protein [Candidatus Sumerlaeia bacterium]|nr:SRPBCC domain-containing protein [Candidatus Sumerlaeia bacterium]